MLVCSYIYKCLPARPSSLGGLFDVIDISLLIWKALPYMEADSSTTLKKVRVSVVFLFIHVCLLPIHRQKLHAPVLTSWWQYCSRDASRIRGMITAQWITSEFHKNLFWALCTICHSIGIWFCALYTVKHWLNHSGWYFQPTNSMRVQLLDSDESVLSHRVKSNCCGGDTEAQRLSIPF